MENTEKEKAIRAELLAAKALIPADVAESDHGYTESAFNAYLEANQLVLAMEELDGLIEDNPSPGREFWTHLISAARLMDHRHADRYEYILAKAHRGPKLW